MNATETYALRRENGKRTKRACEDAKRALPQEFSAPTDRAVFFMHALLLSFRAQPLGIVFSIQAFDGPKAFGALFKRTSAFDSSGNQ